MSDTHSRIEMRLRPDRETCVPGDVINIGVWLILTKATDPPPTVVGSFTAVLCWDRTQLQLVGLNRHGGFICPPEFRDPPQGHPWYLRGFQHMGPTTVGNADRNDGEVVLSCWAKMSDLPQLELNKPFLATTFQVQVLKGGQGRIEIANEVIGGRATTKIGLRGIGNFVVPVVADVVIDAGPVDSTEYDHLFALLGHLHGGFLALLEHVGKPEELAVWVEDLLAPVNAVLGDVVED